MDVKTLCLGVLTEGEASGYDIKKTFECTFSHFFVAGFGSIYPALAELTEKGLVTCRAEAQASRPDRKVYAITAAGREVFQQSLESTPPRHKIRSEFLVLLHFAHRLPEDRLRAIIDERLGELTRDLSMLEHLFAQHDRGEWDIEPGQRFGAGMAHAAMKASRDFITEYRQNLLEQITTRGSQTSRKRA
ncbi:MAG: PadR family transcriptional regulator [Gammaproteobacteria bacterium]|nr:PadR family transcriptional regulator [Gammaproteobacteria bacterium]